MDDEGTETTQLLIKAKTDNLDVALSTRATEATLAGVAKDATLTSGAVRATVAQGAAATGLTAWPVQPTSSLPPYIPLDIINTVVMRAAELAPVDDPYGSQPLIARAGTRDSVGAR